jgi:hypothetical protein
MLKEVIADPKATRKERLRAGETLLAIYERHDRSEDAKARKRNAEAAGKRTASQEHLETVPATSEAADAQGEGSEQPVDTRAIWAALTAKIKDPEAESA